MELHICHLYPDLLNSYGDIGNVTIMARRLERRGIQAIIHNVSIGDPFNKDDYDIVFFGGGQDFEQAIVSDDLKQNKKDALQAYIEENKVFIAICGGYQLLGHYYMSAENEKLEGLHILDIHTEKGDKRAINNLILQDGDRYYAGFENHSGRTIIGDLKPLGKVAYGFGNDGNGYEGCRYKNTIGTYLHGPLFSKNPELCDEVLEKALSLHYHEEIKLQPLDDTFEHKAKQVVLDRYLNKE